MLQTFSFLLSLIPQPHEFREPMTKVLVEIFVPETLRLPYPFHVREHEAAFLILTLTEEKKEGIDILMTTLYPGRSLSLSNIEEGDDVYFECAIKANPWVYNIVWLHEGHELRDNVSAGIIISNKSLVLQKIARMASGNYYCITFNIEGD
ncbi:hypothetical protein SK128_016173, partial [Halocaridina rubra]